MRKQGLACNGTHAVWGKTHHTDPHSTGTVSASWWSHPSCAAAGKQVAKRHGRTPSIIRHAGSSPVIHLRTIETNLPCFQQAKASKNSSFVACSPQLGSKSSIVWHDFHYFRGKNQMEAESSLIMVPLQLPKMQKQQKQHQQQPILSKCLHLIGWLATPCV